MRAINFLVIFSLIFNTQFAFAQVETSGGGKKTSTGSNKKTSAAEPDVQLKKGKCPTALKESVLDDYQDKSTLMVFKFNSEAKTCNGYVTAYQNYMSGNGIQTNFQTPQALSTELSKQFSSTISPSMARTLNGCNTSPDLTPEQAKVAQTRFYAAATRIEKFNKSAMDEIAFIDSVTEGTPVLDGIECNPLLPDLKSSCENLRNTGGQCKGQAADRFEEQVQKTMDNLGKISALQDAELKCRSGSMVKCAGSTQDCPMRGGYTYTSQKTATKKCENIGKAIEILRDEVPWVRGEIFDKIAREKAKPRSSERKYLSREKIKEGLREQLKANRTALAGAYKDNLQNLRCLIYDTDDKGEKCDFAKVRTELAKLDAPKVPQLADRRSNMEFKTYFDAESCLLDRGEDRAGTKNVVDNAALDAGLTVLTAGLGSIAVGAKVIGGLSKTAIATRRGAFAGTLAVDGYFAQGSMKQAYQSCTNKNTAILDNLSVKDKQKNMVCDNAKSQVTIARENDSSCKVDALLASVDVLPFVGAAAPLLARGLKATPSAPTPPTVSLNATPPKVETPAPPTPAQKAQQAATKPEEKPKSKPAADKPATTTAKTNTEKPAATNTAAKTPPEKTNTAKPNSDKPVDAADKPVVAAADSTKPAAVATANPVDTTKPVPAVDKPTEVATKDLTTNEKINADFFDTVRPKAPPVAASVARTDGIAGKVTDSAKQSGHSTVAAMQSVVIGKPTTVRISDETGEIIPATVTKLQQTPQGNMAEVAYQHRDGSMRSRRVRAQELYQTNPEIKDDNQFYEFLASKLKTEQAVAQNKVIPQPAKTMTPSVANYSQPAGLDMRSSSSNNSAMAVAAAPSRPAAAAQAVATPVIQRNQPVIAQADMQNFGNAAPANNVQRGSSRSPASESFTQNAPSTAAEDELVRALTSNNNTGAVAPVASFAKVKPEPVSIFKSNSGGGSGSTPQINAKVDNRPTTYVDKSDNVRFIEGEQIKVSNFEGGKDAEFKIVKKLENGLLRVSDGNGKEFDLLRDEVKSAERLAPPTAKAGATEVVEKIKLKEEFIRPGDAVNVKNFEGGSELNASVVRKNTDGTVRVKDEAGKEFDLIKSEVKDAEFSRGLTAEIKQNLEIADDVVRVKTAENYLQRPLTAVQQQAVLKSHKIAEDKGIFALSKTELRQKAKALRDAGLSEDEASLLLRKGVTGSPGLDNVRIVSEQSAIPKFDIIKGKQLEVPMGNTGRTNPGAVMSGPDARGYYEVEFYQKGAGIGRTRKTAAELTAANVKLPGKIENPIINVPVVGKDVSYPGKVISGPNGKGQYEVEIYPPGKPATVVRMNEIELKKANTPQAVRQAKIREARRASFADRSSAELEQILDDSLRQADSRGGRDAYNVDYGVSGKPDKALKSKKIDIEGQRALEELAKRQNKEINELYEEVKLARKAKPQMQVSTKSTDVSQADVFNSAQAGGARNELDYLAEQDGLKTLNLNPKQRQNAALELGIADENKIAAMDYPAVASRKEARELFSKVFPNGNDFDDTLLRQTMSFNPRGGYINAREFANAEKFVAAVRKADINAANLSLAERRLLNKFTDRAPLYARQTNADVALLPRQSLEVDSAVIRKIASADSAPISVRAVDPAEVAGDARNQLDYLAEQDRLKSSRLNPRQRESVARELGIYNENKAAALDYASVGSKKESSALFDKLFPGKKDFDTEMLRQSMSYNPRGGYIGNAEFANAEKFVKAVQKADIDGSTLSLSERRLLNKYTDRAPLYARQVNPAIETINRQSLEAVVPPRIISNKVSAFAARGDEVVAQVKIKPEMVRAGDQVTVKNFEALAGGGGADLDAKFIRRNKDGTIRVKDSQGKEFNLGAQATSESQFYRGLTAELKVNGDLDNPSRVKAAADYVKRPLTEAQKNAVLASHNVGGEGRGYFDYTAKELKEKTAILRKAGFSNPEATLLLRKGITGNNSSEISQLIKVTPSEVRIGDQVVIHEFNGTGELRGAIAGDAHNGGLILREANGAETIIYKNDLDDLTNAQITRNPNARFIANAEELSLERAPIVAAVAKKAVPVDASNARVGDKVLISEFNGTGELEGVITGPAKNGGYLLREVNGKETIIYKTDLEDTTNTKITREWGSKPPVVKREATSVVDNTPDSPLLVSKDKKQNPDIVVPLGNGELRQGRVLSQLEAKPGVAKTYVVEYLDEAGIANQIHLTQDQLLATTTPDALKKVKADRERSATYQSKSNSELQQILDEGHRAAKDAVGKGRSVDKPDLNAETHSALSELARRSGVTSNAVFEAYRRGGVKGLENLALAQNIIRSPASVTNLPVTPIIVKPLAQLKTGDYVVTAGIGDKVKEGLVVGRDKIKGEIIYTVGVVNKDGSTSFKKMTDRELGDSNSAYVGVKVESSRSKDPLALRSQIDEDFKNARSEAQLADLRRKARLKVEGKTKVIYDDASNPLLANSAGVTTPEGAVYINIDYDTDARFSTLLHEVSHTKTDRARGDLRVQSVSKELSAQGYGKGFSFDEIKAATVNFAVDKQTVIAQSKAGKPAIPNRAVKRDISNMQTSVDRRQAFINDSRDALDQVDESLGSIVAKDVGRSGDKNFTVWQITLNNVEGKTDPVHLSFSTPVNMSRSEAMGQLREFSREEKIKLLNAQSRLDYDKAYLTELRTKVGVPKRAQPLNGESVFQVVEAKGVARNPATDRVKAQALSSSNASTNSLVEELDSVIGIRGRSMGLRSTAELTSGHPLTPVIEKQRQIVNRLSRADREFQPENFARISSNVANDFLKSGDVDLALPYYRLTAETIENNLGSTAKSFWASEVNTKAAIKAGFISDNTELAHMATQKSVLAKTKSNAAEDVKKVALDQYHNLGYEYDRVLYGVKRYGNKNKELELLVIRKQQQHIAQKYGLKNDIEALVGKDGFQKIDEQADLTVDDLIQNPKQIIDPEKFKKTQRIPASTSAPSAMVTPSAALPVELKAVHSGISKSTPELEAQVDRYVEALRGADLSPKEVKSILHQEDLIAATRNPVVAKVLDKARVDYQGLKFGMLDSDVGKLAKFQENLLLKNTKESDELFDTLRGTVKTPAAQELKTVLKDLGFPHPNLLNPNLTNQEVREIIAEVPVLRGYLHELPGMQLAIRDLNAGHITQNQFRERILANLGHNGPNEGYWSFLSNNIVPTSLGNAKHPKAKLLFADSIFATDQVINGVVIPRYPAPQSPAGIVHSTFDRLSQGTRGGVDKIFYELGGAPLAANPKTAIREIGVPPNKGLQLPHEMLIGNPEKTMSQLEALQQHAATSPQFSKTQQTELSHFVGGAIARLQKQNDFIQQNVIVVKDSNGLIKKMTLRYQDKKIVLTNDSPAEDVAGAMEKMLRHEESLHGDPFKEFKLAPQARAATLAAADAAKLDQRHSQASLDYLLVNIAKRSDNEKAEAPEVVEFLKRYKNDPAFAGWLKNKDVTNSVHYDVKGNATKLLLEYKNLERTPAAIKDPVIVNLADQKLLDPSRLNAWQVERQINFKRSQYDNVLSGLKKGDVVQATSAQSGKVESFELGDYIGAGNTSNLYAMKDPNKVVRLPFLTTGVSGQKSGKDFFQTYVQTRDKYVGIPGLDVVKVFDHGKNFEYIVNERVPIKMTLNEVEDRLFSLKATKTPTDGQKKELNELQAVWDKFTKIAPEIAKRSNDQTRVTSLQSAKAIDRDTALVQEARQVALTPDGRLVLLDWE